MASAARKAWLQEQEGGASGTAQNRPPNILPTWLHHPFVVLAIPLFVLLCAPSIYGLLPPRSLKHTQESQVQEIASLIEDIYFTFVNMSFIPPTAIKRGPHHINTTAMPCKRTTAALRFMEMMPYVDQDEVMEKDDVYRTNWLFGGEFIDYRKAYQLERGCNPVRSDRTWHEVHSTTVALTRWGGDRTWVLLYDTEYNAISVYEGENLIALYDKDNPGEKIDSQYTNIDIFTHSAENPLAALSRDNPHWETWFDAPTLLKRILTAYQSLTWTPWETSNRREGWGVSTAATKNLLRKNGWPHSFDPDQFNADFIRARHAPSRHGPAEAAYKIVEDLQGRIDDLGTESIGAIATQKQEIAYLESKLLSEDDEQEYWFLVFRIQSKRWALDNLEADLLTATREISRLCPSSSCVKHEDIILWHLHSLENAYRASQRAPPIPTQCDSDLRNLVTWTPPPPSLLQNCIAKRRREAHWLERAYNQTKSEALLSHTESAFIPLASLEERVVAQIARFELDIVRDQNHAVRMYDWLPTLPEHATKARMYFEMEASAAANGPWNVRDRIEWLRELLNGGDEDRVKLWRCLDTPDCM